MLLTFGQTRQAWKACSVLESLLHKGGFSEKKLINNPDNIVLEALDGMAAAHRDIIRVHKDPNFITRISSPVKGKVALLSGGGSGLEPLHGGFVGLGMLDAACPGAIFTSATPDQMLAATKAVDGGAGVLHIVKPWLIDRNARPRRSTSRSRR